MINKFHVSSNLRQITLAVSTLQRQDVGFFPNSTARSKPIAAFGETSSATGRFFKALP